MSLSCMWEVVFGVVFLSFLFPLGAQNLGSIWKLEKEREKRKENNEGKFERKAKLEFKIGLF